jgi:hypothetical protein
MFSKIRFPSCVTFGVYDPDPDPNPDPDLDRHQNGKSVPNPDRHLNETDPQHFKYGYVTCRYISCYVQYGTTEYSKKW